MELKLYVGSRGGTRGIYGEVPTNVGKPPMRARGRNGFPSRMEATAARTYLVECFTPGVEQHAVEAMGIRARIAAASLQAQGHNIQYVNALLVPDDEVVFHVFAGDSPEMVRKASVGAEIPFERIIEFVAIGGSTTALADVRATRV